MKTLPKVATEMALHVLAYNFTRVMNIVGINSTSPHRRGVSDLPSSDRQTPIEH